MIAIIQKLKIQCPKCGYKNDLDNMIKAKFYNKCLMCGHEEKHEEDQRETQRDYADA
jgi:DNA-directed RNA polymerase subunit RPC12/RpoP